MVQDILTLHEKIGTQTGVTVCLLWLSRRCPVPKDTRTHAHTHTRTRTNTEGELSLHEHFVFTSHPDYCTKVSAYANGPR